MKAITVAFSVVLLVTGVSFAQSPSTPPNPPADPMQHGQMQMMNCQAMMTEMQAGMKAMDDRLTQLVDDMNKARGSARTDKTVAVINELVTQRRQMRDHMMTMMPKMMDHMMKHMQDGMMSGMSQAMRSCPMMQGTAPAQEQHH